MSYIVLLHHRANRFLEKTEEKTSSRIRVRLRAIGISPDHGELMVHSNFRKVRIGDYRAIYEIDHDRKRVIVLFIGHRKDVYDDFSRML